MVEGLIIQRFLNKNIIELMSESDIYRFLTILIANALLFVILFLTQNMINKNGFELENSELSLIGTIFIISIFSFMFLYFSIFNNESRTSNLFISVAIIGLVVINLSAYLLISKLNQKHIIEMQNQLLKQQNKAQFESIEEIKRQFEETQKIRHDFKNTLQVLKVLLDDKSYEKIGNLIVENLNQIQDTHKLIATNSEYVNAIVNLT